MMETNAKTPNLTLGRDWRIFGGGGGNLREDRGVKNISRKTRLSPLESQDKDSSRNLKKKQWRMNPL